MPRRFPVFLAASAALLLAAPGGASGQATNDESADPHAFADLTSPAHDYWTRELKDPFTRFKADFEAGKIELDFSSEKAFVISLLKVLDIPATSQMLLFSTTSLQLRFISPRNPRSLFFNEDVYLGYIPGGRIEIISLDPEVGGIFYIFDIPQNGARPVVERSERCMNCHADDDTRQVPGIAIKSVIPGPTGGSLNSYRREQIGHQIPFSERFGGWHLTSGEEIGHHWGNLIGRLSNGEMSTQKLEPGTLFSWDKYPVATSDILPQLIHEHQGGFVDRVVEASYRARAYLHEGNGRLTNRVHIETLKKTADELVRYLLFADEAEFPRGGIAYDTAYAEDFARHAKRLPNGASLRDLDMETRLFKYRCSYMIDTAIFRGIPDVFKQHVYRRLGEALSVEKPDPAFGYLPSREKQAIQAILRGTLEDLPKGW